MNVKSAICSSLLALSLGAWAPANATVIGIAVDGPGSTTQVGSANADGTINFYALLNGSGTYGVGGVGLSPDTCTNGYWSSTCTGGTLDMWLHFSPVELGANELTLEFEDLDLFGINDPTYFFESVEIFDSALQSIAYVDSLLDPEVVMALTDAGTQTLSLLLNVASDPFYTRLRFSTNFVGAPHGSFVNTPETLLATISSVAVSEPATLTLLGGALLLLGFARRRRA